MTRDNLLTTIKLALPEIREQFDVRDLWIFGSIARNSAVEDSDLDVLVDFEGPATFDRYMGLKLFLEDLSEMDVDLVTRKSLRERLRPAIEREAIRVA